MHELAVRLRHVDELVETDEPGPEPDAGFIVIRTTVLRIKLWQSVPHYDQKAKARGDSLLSKKHLKIG